MANLKSQILELACYNRDETCVEYDKKQVFIYCKGDFACR